MSNFDLVLRLFLQLSVILFVCRLAGWIGTRYLRQTQVVSEMVAGVLLGPSLFGAIAPEIQQWLFPAHAVVGGVTIAHPSMSILYALGQIGLVFYMFLVGLEFDPSLIRGRVRSAAAISITGIAVPFAGGALIALAMHGEKVFFHERVSVPGAALFVGASMSITAFPMLARILQERGMSNTRLGVTALSAGSIDDALAWCLLAAVLASFQATPSIALIAIVGAVVYGVAMLTVGRKALARFERLDKLEGSPAVGAYTGLFLVVMLCAWFTDAIGIYAVFGAFLVGVAMPKGGFAKQVKLNTELMTTALFLPVFFAYSGLNTQLGLVSTGRLWLWTALVVGVAILAKGVACTLAAHATGEGWRDATILGVLMNARGLMELIILNIGLDRGLITPTLFTMMVVMAVVTTIMTSPLFHLLQRPTR